MCYLGTNIKLGAMMGIEIYKYREHTVLVLTYVKTAELGRC